jgi:arsenate reductase
VNRAAYPVIAPTEGAKMPKQKILFICVHNSARSQMAEGWLNYVCGEFFSAQSAGLEAGKINPLVVEAMAEVGIDLSGKETQEVFEVWKSGQYFAYVITVCSEAEATSCPIFPGVTKRLHWPFRDPSQLTGTDQEKLREIRKIRDEIRTKIESWCEEVCPTALGPSQVDA